MNKERIAHGTMTKGFNTVGIVPNPIWLWVVLNPPMIIPTLIIRGVSTIIRKKNFE